MSNGHCPWFFRYEDKADLLQSQCWDNRHGLEAILEGWKRVECLAGAVEDEGLQFKVLHNLWNWRQASGLLGRLCGFLKLAKSQIFPVVNYEDSFQNTRANYDFGRWPHKSFYWGIKALLKHDFWGKTHFVLFSYLPDILHLVNEKVILDICTGKVIWHFHPLSKVYSSYVDEFVCLGSRGSTSGGGGLGLEGNLVIWWIGVVAEWSLVGYVVSVSLYCVCMFHNVCVFPCIFVWVPIYLCVWVSGGLCMPPTPVRPFPSSFLCGGYM